jgi:hypothetical protein
MSKKARAAAKERRLKKKRAKKAEQKARYESYKLLGQNKKSKRVKLGNKRKANRVKAHELCLVPARVNGELVLVLRSVHRGSRCGNAGCLKCSLTARLSV